MNKNDANFLRSLAEELMGTKLAQETPVSRLLSIADAMENSDSSTEDSDTEKWEDYDVAIYIEVNATSPEQAAREAWESFTGMYENDPNGVVVEVTSNNDSYQVELTPEGATLLD